MRLPTRNKAWNNAILVGNDVFAATGLHGSSISFLSKVDSCASVNDDSINKKQV
jgi:hypothetical protein